MHEERLLEFAEVQAGLGFYADALDTILYLIQRPDIEMKLKMALLQVIDNPEKSDELRLNRLISEISISDKN